ncbi:DUF6048 family protein [Constantimarinum furrinae]|uniref:Uncharacterized protein n=1 Tax=Constantimarinum furrinae TaxID=2562285 RepID=A0A7G8PX42_9FLAO|nr:DUF6048 family protein [Constantimarinum furrinae]QNJ98908.1 hypothetical protein ALE3EI_2369 [Constantimarinum furrinae]
MKQLLILLFFISLYCIPVSAQEQQDTDSISNNEKYGLRVGIDIAKPLRTLLEDGYSGFEIMGDFRVSDKFYAAAELGNEKKERFESNLNSIASGSYIKIGADYNAYNNWLGMENSIFGGLRYGLSTFKQELLAYGIYTTNQTFPPGFRVEPQEFTGLTAHWAELIVGVKVEVINNLYLSLNLQLKQMISEDKPENFDNLYIPGFNRTYDFSKFGAGYGYSISYLIPIFKK